MPLVDEDVGAIDAVFRGDGSSVSVAATLTMSPVTGGMRRCLPFLKSVFDLRSLAHTIVIGRDAGTGWRCRPSVSPFLTLYFWTRPLPSGTVVSTAIGLTSVPSSMNGPSTAAALVAEISVSPKSMAANGESGLVTSAGWPNSTLPVERVESVAPPAAST